MPWSYGDDPALDTLWDACDAGDGNACDQLYAQAPGGSDYEAFGDTCGGRTSGGTPCAEDAGSDSAGEVDSLCVNAVEDMLDVPTSGDSQEDFAIQWFAIAEILRDLSAALASEQALDLSAAVQRYAEAYSDLAVATDQGRYDLDSEYARVEETGQGVEKAAAELGSASCQEVASV